MNISQPVSSELESVEFTSLSSSEIKLISVKRIENPQTLDHLTRPVPGGLYDTALGAWGDIPCATCNLTQTACPGHPGHIDLPLPVYHPINFEVLMRLLRSQCIHCYRFRMRRVDISRAVCKLRLLQYGLLHEATMIDDITDTYDSSKQPETDSEGEGKPERIVRLWESFVRRTLQNHRITRGELRKAKHEGAAQMRRTLLQDLLKELPKGRTCAMCKGLSPTYRKDGFVKIFQKALSPKEQAKLVQGNFKLQDALTVALKDERTGDEAIADMSSESEEDGDEGEGESLDAAGDVVMEPGRVKKAPRNPEDKQKYLVPSEVKQRMVFLFEREKELLELIFNSRPVDKRLGSSVTAESLFIDTILIPPNRFRPEAKAAGSKITEAQQNVLFTGILNACSRLAMIHREMNSKEATARLRDISELQGAWAQVQEAVNSLIDRDKNPTQGRASIRNEDGIKQKLEKKEGLFRKNMMGKRVNYAARSVISPDPNIETNEIGVPPVFAQKLTYPEPVTSHNFRELQQAVINGPDKWPGALAIENENGQVINLGRKKPEERMSLANQLLAPSNTDLTGISNKKVYRHLTNGDVVLMNRQPTLHKPSIMGHRVRVLPGEKTIRMHYANCNTYNADFDGDEMNMHFPQSEIARSEALQIADTDHQYLSGTQGKPLRGLIQDHLSVSVSLCNRDTFFDRGSYYQLVYSAIRPESGHIVGERIELFEPAILKPVPRWTGKQVISTILRNIQPVGCGKLNMSGKTQLKPEQWADKSEEANVLFHNGDFISGILDKAHLGPSSGGLIHAVHETYGPSIAGKLLSSIGRLLTRYLNMRAFTCGMDDLKLTPMGEKMRKEQLQAARAIGLEIAANYVTLQDENAKEDDPELLVRLEGVMRDDTKQHALDLLMNQGCAGLSTSITKACLPAGLEKKFPKNQMQTMTTSGAKGSGVNANLISCNLGQQVLEGRRVPLMVSGKSLPCFSPFDTNVRAGGYIVNRFLTGIRPQEYYFHHMAGREGLIDTAVKTASSGYLQRCLIKGMEGLKTSYDSTVRDSDGTLIQFLFGEDGVDVTKAKYLNDFAFTLRNIDSELSKLHLGRPNGQAVLASRDDILKRMKRAIKHANDQSPSDPVTSSLNPARFAYATSEKFYLASSSYLRENKDGLIKAGVLSRKAAETVLTAKYNRSLVEPGEAVGIVAGQSVGEPSTQMTLNTFHLAGHSAKNVTLGIPRLREILMTASDHISTPAMTLFPNEELSDEECERFAKAISVLPLAYVLDKATVQERVGNGKAISPAKIFDIRLDFFPSKEYMMTYAVQVSDVLEAVERKFIPTLIRLIEKEIKKQDKGAVLEIGAKSGTVEMAAHSGKTGSDNDGDGDDDDDDDGDGDATSAKKRANRSEAVSYGPNDEDDDAIQAQMQRDVSSEPEDEGIGASPQASSDDEEGEDGKGTMANRIKTANQRVTRYRADAKGGDWVEFTFEFKAEIPKILVLNILLDAIRKCVIQQLDGINACTFVADEKMKDPETGLEVPTRVIHTNGVNLQAMQNYADYINPHKTSTNDIAAVLRVYGVEACRNSIIQELSGVFTSHGITVDNRHLNLIADYMTRNGEFTPFNRIGLKGNVSPFTKMSFETTVAFLRDAMLDGDWDDLRAPSSRLVMGKHALVGTNSFDVYSSMD